SIRGILGIFVVISSRLLWTLPEPEAAIKEWLRVLKTGGRIIAVNELEKDGIRSWSFDDPSRYLGAEIPVEDFSFANADTKSILETFRTAGAKDVRIEHMKGCHMVKSDAENWYAFIASRTE
ncbi:MAG: methyltransferase domain-containing protein, partial [Firmicutes bacterium]|nr:methyltransferase domain-containing protein [Bacillota bacterium]